MAKSDRTSDTQYAALPYRITAAGCEIMLITSRETKRWVIPKGWPMIGKKPFKLAEIEAFQEAGVKGVVGKTPIGTYHYAKTLPTGGERLCAVEVYPLRVTLETAMWREKTERQRAWFPQERASQLVDEGGLAHIIDAWL